MSSESKLAQFFVGKKLRYYFGSAFSLTNFRRSLLLSWLSIRGCIRGRNTYWIRLLRISTVPPLIWPIFGPETTLSNGTHLSADISSRKLRLLLLAVL